MSEPHGYKPPHPTHHPKKGWSGMRVEALTTCVNYADFLAWTLPFSKAAFDRLIVITDTKDRRTRDLCEHHFVECLATDAFYREQRAFDKGAAISEGLAKLNPQGWVCHLDADIALPPRAKNILDRLDLDPAGIYGIDRMMCASFADWTRHLSAPEVQHSCDAYIQATTFPLGTRVARLREDGYVPIGFFQLWNANASGRRTYPSHGLADRSDMRFATQWPRAKRHLIPELVGIHISTEEATAEMGVNWAGRRTREFGP